MAGWWTGARQATAYNYLTQFGGLSPYGAAGLVSRWANVESTGGGATAVNPYSGAFGIAQWLGGRLPAIKGNTDFTAQLAYVVKELNSTEARAAAVLRAAQTPAEGARGASMYERAEGYNGNTGIDNWTAKTAAGLAGVLASVGAVAPLVAAAGAIGGAITLPVGTAVVPVKSMAEGVGLLSLLAVGAVLLLVVWDT